MALRVCQTFEFIMLVHMLICVLGTADIFYGVSPMPTAVLYDRLS